MAAENGGVEVAAAEDYVVVKAGGEEDGGAAPAVAAGDGDGDLAGGEAGEGGSEATAEGTVAKKGGSGGAAAAAARKAGKVAVPNGKVAGAPAARGKKPVLSQSASFPARGAVAKKAAVPAAAAAATATPKQAKTGVSNGSEKAAGRAAEKKVNSSRTTAARRSLPVKSGSVDATPNDVSSEAPQESNENTTNALQETLPGKMEDDVHSTTSSTNTPRAAAQRKNAAASGFSFRLQERAEKRKEFYQKLEEKIHAKELEQTNLQAKSKESQEAEIKLLRKSLTFKATPMPSFYKEQPPKVELKKIPPTRARSPKLGRHKPTNSVAVASADGSVSCESPRSITNLAKLTESAENNKSRVTARKPAQRSVTRTPQESATAKTETKPLGTKQKTSNTKPKAPRAKVEQLQENPVEIPPAEPSGPEGVTVEHGVEDATAPDRAATLVASSEVPVQG